MENGCPDSRRRARHGDNGCRRHPRDGGKMRFRILRGQHEKDKTKALEEAYARAELPVVSNNSANRWTPDVPMVIPEINDAHLAVIAAQKARLGTRRGFIAVKPNCSIQSYVPALTPLLPFGIEQVVATTYQAISGAGEWKAGRLSKLPLRSSQRSAFAFRFRTGTRRRSL